MFLYYENILTKFDKNILTKYLKSIDDFKYNPKISDPTQSGRLQKWYQKDQKYFCPEWKERLDWWKSFEYDTNLLYYQNIIQNKINNLGFKVNINSCLINKYRNGNDYIAPHRDSKLSFGDKPIISILSLGEKRTLRFIKVLENDKDMFLTKNDKNKQIINFELSDNSLFIMTDDSQINYSHQLIKDNTVNERYSLTFREFIL